MQTRPERVLEMAVHGMLPKNRLGRRLFNKLKIYRGADHPHVAQNPAGTSSDRALKRKDKTAFNQVTSQMAENKNTIRTTGRRKTAVAGVRLLPGSGTITVNDRSLEVYFPRDTSRMRILEPFELTETNGHYDVIVSVRGGGIAAQADAVRHGISRALVTVSEALRPALRKNGMLTRDPREVERKKYGRHKARKRPQYSKR